MGDLPSLTMALWRLALVAPVAVFLSGCGSSPSGTTGCGTTGSGTQPTVNRPDLTCNNCGPAPCVDANGKCWSCYSAAGGGGCYKYKCGNTCQNTPCTTTCGTTGSGTQYCANDPSRTCTNCGPAPCVDNSNQC